MVRHALVTLLLIAAAPAYGAPGEAEKTVTHLSPPLGCNRITIAEGLPSPHVGAITQDAQGFVWLGTEDGLARYDGITMRVYRPKDDDPKSISAAYITALQVDADGKLWVGTTEGGVNLYDPKTDGFTRFTRGKGLSAEGVTAITRDPKNRIWVALSTGGLARWEPSNGTFVDFLAKPLDVAITSMQPAKDGSLWLGTASDGVIHWNPDDPKQTTQFREVGEKNIELGRSPVTSMLVASTGKIWFGTDGDGLFILDPATKAITEMRHDAGDPKTITDDHVLELLEDKNKAIWLGTANGLNKVEPNGLVTRFSHDPKDPRDPTKLAFASVESMFQDKAGVMWAGGFTVGVCTFDETRQRFGHYRTRTHGMGFFEDPDGSVWVGSYNGLYHFDWTKQQITHYQTLGKAIGDEGSVSLESTFMHSILRDKKGTLWLALQRNGLVAFDAQNETYKRYIPDPDKPNSLPVDIVFDQWEDDKGTIWLASWGAGLVKLDPETETFTSIMMPEGDSDTGLTSNHLYQIYPDPKEANTIWLGTAKGGLVKYNIASNTATAWRHQPGNPATLSSDDVLSIHRDPSGIVWVGTFGGGLNRLDPATGKVQQFTTSNSALTNNTIQGVLPGLENQIWVSTNGGGLLSLDTKTNTFTAYTVTDGVQDTEFSQSSFMRAKSGRLFFGGASGFNAFFPKDIARDPYVPPIAFTGFKIGNQDVKLAEPIWTQPRIHVSYADSFEIQFAALGFAAPKRNRYAYKLEGYDDKWIETDRPFATYAKLDGGTYTLRVRAANQHGVWNEEGIALKVEVKPPIWRTWPAYAAYLLLLAGIAFVIVRIQRNRIRRVEREGRLAVVEQDLALTGAVQSGFLPEHNEFTTEHVRLFGFYRPADACSGDWWWYEAMSRDRHLIIVGDVTGHGPGPAMVTAAVATAFRVFLQDGLDDVDEGLERLNREVLKVAKGKYHMTMAVLELVESTGEWTLYSAGAPPMLSLNVAGKHRVHFCPGAPLGTETGFELGKVQGKLKPSERLLLYTDGIPEIILPNGNVIGMRRFAQQYEQTRHQELRDAASSILQFADTTRGNEPQNDDWTFAMIQWG